MVDSQAMLDKVWFILPEIWLVIGAMVVSMMGLSGTRLVRDAVCRLADRDPRSSFQGPTSSPLAATESDPERHERRPSR